MKVLAVTADNHISTMADLPILEMAVTAEHFFRISSLTLPKNLSLVFSAECGEKLWHGTPATQEQSKSRHGDWSTRDAARGRWARTPFARPSPSCGAMAGWPTIALGNSNSTAA